MGEFVVYKRKDGQIEYQIDPKFKDAGITTRRIRREAIDESSKMMRPVEFNFVDPGFTTDPNELRKYAAPVTDEILKRCQDMEWAMILYGDETGVPLMFKDERIPDYIARIRRLQAGDV